MPKISVIMGVFNCASTLGKSIESIQAQTFSDWEFIICDDGSNDESATIVRSYAEKDSRIVFIQNDKNHGLPYTLNHCLQYARGEYCARMDGDDYCAPERLEKQNAFLDNHQEFAFVSSRVTRFDEKGVYSLKRKPSPCAPEMIELVKGSPFCHAAAMIRKSAYDAVNGYRDLSQIMGNEDYDLWFRLYSKDLKGYIIDEALYYFFDGRDATQRRTFKRRLREAWVRKEGYKLLHVPFYYRVYILKPIILGLVPRKMLTRLKKA